MSPPDAVPLRFGEDSFFPHLAAAAARGIEPSVVRLPGIALRYRQSATTSLILRGSDRDARRPAARRTHRDGAEMSRRTGVTKNEAMCTGLTAEAMFATILDRAATGARSLPPTRWRSPNATISRR